MKVTVNGTRKSFLTVSWDESRNILQLIDQRLLPHRFQILSCSSVVETAESIKNMTVRGAGAIGATAAYGLAQSARDFSGSSLRDFRQQIDRDYRLLKNARPTAVDPVNAMNGVRSAMQPGKTVAEKKALAADSARQFAQSDIDHCRAIGLHGAPLIKSGMNVLTHCNAGWLAFVDIGSATAPLYAARDQGRKFRVYVDETRPRCQGSTLTAWELAQEKIDHRIIADNAAGHLMQRGLIDLVIVGADRVVGKTGEVANKIGTYTKAVLAARHGIPFYVAIPLSTLDWKLNSGKKIPIEERSAEEVLGIWGESRAGKRMYVRVANPGSGACNPGFDVTPPSLITGIITPMGIIRPKELWKRRKLLGHSP